LKLKCDEPLSNVAFNFNVRRYTEGASLHSCMTAHGPDAGTFERASAGGACDRPSAIGGAVQVNLRLTPG
jgi:homogentisate 1,2-dioxygenase